MFALSLRLMCALLCRHVLLMCIGFVSMSRSEWMCSCTFDAVCLLNQLNRGS